MSRKILVIGWDSADWKIINPLMDAGEMPALQSLVENGVCGNIATLDPPLSPMLWTSIATGMRPHKHGILGFLEPDSTNKHLRQTLITSRKVKAVWNILNQNKKKSNVIGWWPSHPAEPVNGTILSNFYQTANFSKHITHWPLQSGTVHPESSSEFYASLRVHPSELTAAHILPFIPKATEIDQLRDRSLIKLTKNLAETASVHNAFTYLLEHDKDWDFTGVYYEAPDLISHAFMKYHPPKMEHIPEKYFELYKGIVNGIYKFMDMMLDRTLDLIDENTTVILLSDHGFHSDHLRPKSLPKEPAAIAMEHSPYGIFVAKGPGIKKDERIYGASVLDITPTILTLFGLPVGADMDGKPLLQILENPVKPEVIPSWEFIKGDSGQHPETFRDDIYEVKDEKALKQLADLGYIEEPGENNDDENFKNNIRENRFYLARSYFNANQHYNAIEILEELSIEKPVKFRYAKYLFDCHLTVNNLKRCSEIIGDLEEYRKANLDNKTAQTEKKEIITEMSLLLMKGSVLINEMKIKEAITCYEKAYRNDTITSKFSLGYAYLMGGRTNEAIGIFKKEIQNNPQNSNAHYYLGLSSLENGDYENAIDSLLESIGLIYFNPMAHYKLGEALMGANLYEEAAQAFEVALRLAPKMYKAKKQLEIVCREYLHDDNRYQQIMSADIYAEMPVIYIVSGLPRSGTSMMMQLLDAAGMDIFTDNLRTADENNKKGYYEHEAVKIIHKDNAWLINAKDKVVKIVSHLLPYLPMKFKYKIIYMQRDLDEILISQNKMLQQLGKIPKDAVHYSLKQNFVNNELKTKAWLEDKINVDVLFVNYNDTLMYPGVTLQKLNAFLGLSIDDQKFMDVIDKSLYRNKK